MPADFLFDLQIWNRLFQLIECKTTVTEQNSALIGNRTFGNTDRFSMLHFSGFTDDGISLFGTSKIVIAAADSNYHLSVRDHSASAGSIRHCIVDTSVSVLQGIEVICGNGFGIGTASGSGSGCGCGGCGCSTTWNNGCGNTCGDSCGC